MSTIRKTVYLFCVFSKYPHDIRIRPSPSLISAVELSPQEAEDLFNSIYREAAPMDASILKAAPVDASILKAAPVVTTTPPPPPTVPQTERPVATRYADCMEYLLLVCV